MIKFRFCTSSYLLALKYRQYRRLVRTNKNDDIDGFDDILTLLNQELSFNSTFTNNIDLIMF